MLMHAAVGTPAAIKSYAVSPPRTGTARRATARPTAAADAVIHMDTMPANKGTCVSSDALADTPPDSREWGGWVGRAASHIRRERLAPRPEACAAEMHAATLAHHARPRGSHARARGSHAPPATHGVGGRPP